VTDFLFRSSGQYSITGVRSEGTNRFAVFGAVRGGGAWSPTVAIIHGVEVYHTNAPDGRAIILGKMGTYSISGSSMRGKIYLASAGGNSSLSVVGNTIEATAMIEAPPSEFAWNVTTRGNLNSLTSRGAYWPDEEFLLLQGKGKVRLGCTVIANGVPC